MVGIKLAQKLKVFRKKSHALNDKEKLISCNEEVSVEDDEHNRREKKLSELIQSLMQPSEIQWEVPFGNVDMQKSEDVTEDEFSKIVSGSFRATPIGVKTYQEKHMDRYEHESTIMKVLRNHTNVVMLVGSCSKERTLLIEGHQTTVEDLLKSTYSLSEEQVIKVIGGVAKGLLHLHLEGFVHRNITASNVFISNSFVPKIHNYSLSLPCPEGLNGVVLASSEPASTWMAPESLKKRVYSSKSDVFQFGMFCMEVITKGRVNPSDPFQVPAGTGSNLVSLIEDCLQKSPAQRPCMASIVKRLDSMISDN